MSALVEHPGSVIRRLAFGNRARQMQYRRFLYNEAVTVSEMAAHAGEHTALRVAGRDVLAIQDSSELTFGGEKARQRGFGPVGRHGNTSGVLLHAVLAVDALDGALLGLVGMDVLNRESGEPAHRRDRPTEEKESQRWLAGMFAAGDVLTKANSITVVADRESDIYEEFAKRPAHVHLLTRAGQNRCIESSHAKTLFDLAGTLKEQARFAVTIPAAPGRAKRNAELAVRYSPVLVRKPRNGASAGLPKTVALTLVDIKETERPAQGEAIHWRLLTTHQADTPQDARRILDLYRRRWIIEDYFRTLKTAGFDIEETGIEDPQAVIRFTAAAACAAVQVLQLVRARDGTNQALADAFDIADQELIETLSHNIEGKTQRQKNPHPKGTLAFAAWLIARLGSWDGYYGKPGPKVMRIGLQNFQMIKYGHHLEPKDV